MILNEEFLRMQKLAGIKPVNNNDLVLEGINIFIDIFSPKLLTEAEKKKATVSSIIDNSSPEALAFYKALGITYDQLDSEGQRLLNAAFKEAKLKKLSPKEIKTSLLGDKKVTEAEDEESKGVDAIGKLGNWLRKSPIGKAVKNTVAGLLIAVLTVPAIVNTVKLLTPDDTVKVSKTISFDDNADTGNSAYLPSEQAKMNASDVGVKTDDGTLVVPFKLAKGDQAGIKDAKIIDNYVNSLKAKYSDTSISGDVTIKVTSYASNTNNAEKSTTSELPLSQERGETIQNMIPKKIGNVNINVEIEKGDYNNLTKETGEDPTKGAVVAIDQVDSNLEQTTTSQQQSPDKLIPVFNPQYAEFDVKLRDKEEETGKEETGTDQEKSTTSGETSTTKLDTSKTKEYINYFPKLNRNGQIAVVLSAVSPKTSIYNKLGDRQIKSFTDNELTKITDPEAKKIANLILNLRKNPDSLIKKISTATGIKLGTRAKAIQTAPGQKYQPSSQLQKVAETISLLELLNEAAIDNIFSDLGISDSDIKANRIALLALVGSMYAQQGNTTLSILDPKDLTQGEQNELKNLGFTPQGAKGEYVFLEPGQAKSIPQSNFDKKSTTVQTKPDVTKLDTYINKQSSFKKQISRIDTISEFENVVIDIINTLAKYDSLKFSKETQLRILNNLKSRIPEKTSKPLQEKTVNDLYKNSPQDAVTLSKLFKSNSSFQTLIKNIRDEEEAIQFILRAILKYTSKDLDSNEIKNAINRVMLSVYKK